MNLHDELGRHGADATGGSRSRLGSDEVRAVIDGRVRRGRRVRAAGGGVGAVAGVALVAVGAWAVLPGFGGASVDPAGPDEVEAAGMPDTRYVVDDTQPIDPTVPWQADAPGAFVCGADFTVALGDGDGGVVVHDEAVLDPGVVVSTASWVGPPAEMLAQYDQAITPEFWDEAYAHTAMPVEVGRTAHVWSSTVEAEDPADLMYSTRALLLRDGVVAGVGDGAMVTSVGEAPLLGPDFTWSPVPGECTDAGGGVAVADGTYEPVLVTQLWLKSSGDPAATIVSSGVFYEYSGVGDVPEIGAVDPDDGLALSGDALFARELGREPIDGYVACAAALAAGDIERSPQAISDGTLAPVPAWLETARLYGGDGVEEPGAAMPLAADDAPAQMEQVADMVEGLGGYGRLVLTNEDGAWVFDASWSQWRQPALVLERDEPGWFLQLTPDRECGEPGDLGAGAYEARLLVSGENGQEAIVLQPLRVIDGLLDLPGAPDEG